MWIRQPSTSVSRSPAISPLRAPSGGWRQVDTAAYELSSILSAEDAALLESLMNAGSTERVEFLA